MKILSKFSEIIKKVLQLSRFGVVFFSIFLPFVQRKYIDTITCLERTCNIMVELFATECFSKSGNGLFIVVMIYGTWVNYIIISWMNKSYFALM